MATPTTSSDSSASQGLLTSWFSSISEWIPTAQAEETAKDEGGKEEKEDKEEGKEGDEAAPAEEAAEEEEQEEAEVEDIAPAIREECESSKCQTYKHHFDHCQEKVGAGHHKGEDCVEELFHLMHCVDGCATPKLFAKLV